MSDNLSHYVDVAHGFDWNQQLVKNKGIDLAKDLDFDPDDIFETCLVAFNEANAHKLVSNLRHTKDNFDKFLKERSEDEERF